jgi:hypothetical protein
MKHEFGKEIYQFDKVFNVQECESIINYCEMLGFNDIQTNKLGDKFLDKCFRNDQSCLLRDKSFLENLFIKIQAIFPGDYKLNDLIRVSKYSKNSFCKPHQDGIIRKNNRVNNYTLLLYLNKPTGGETVFHCTDDTILKINPKIGTIIIFDRSIEHESMKCKDLKYSLRTDLMFVGVFCEDPHLQDL